MAEETTMTPVEGAEPPKANPLAKPAGSSSTLKLKPIERTAGLKLPPKPGLATAGLKLPPKPGLATAGLKLPPKPGLATQTGLKLPPKPGLATQTGLKLPPKPGLATQTGLKLPPKPGLATAGLKLPPKPALATQTGLKVPTRPVIRKPGASTTPTARPSLLAAKSATVTSPTVTAATVISPAPAPAPAAVPASDIATPAATASGMTPVMPTEVKRIEKPGEKPLEALKHATQNLKSITAPIPQQAILRQTGMLAEEKSPAQQQAAKSKTSRISLSEAMGAAPVLNENAPMKTIRIKRPIDIPGATKPDLKPAAKCEPAAEPTTEPATEASTVVKAAGGTEPAEPGVTMTQRKTLKISRPTGGVMRPSGKFGIKRSGTVMSAKTAKPTETAAPTVVADGVASAAPAGDVPDIADIPSMPPEPVANVPMEKDLPKGVTILGLLIQAAACVAMGALAWFLYGDTQILPF